MKIYAETDRLILREIVPADIDGLFEVDSDSEVHRFIGNNPITNKDQLLEVIEYIRQQYEDNGIGRWAIVDKNSLEFLGWSGLKLVKDIINHHQNYYDLGYRLKKKHWGKGFATESAIAALDYGFHNFNMESIFAITDPGNLISKKILAKLGFDFQQTFDYEGETNDWFELKKTNWKKNSQAEFNN